MIVALLLLIVLILLFGAGVVKGWIASGLQIGSGLLLLLIAIGWAANTYNNYKEERQLQEAADQATADIIKEVSERLKKPQDKLIDRTTHNATRFVICGTVAGTSGYGGEQGRQRWLYDGIYIFHAEGRGKRTEFDKLEARYCSLNNS